MLPLIGLPEVTMFAKRGCGMLQRALVNENWPPELLEHPKAALVRTVGPHAYILPPGESRPLTLFRGLRVRMGLETGEPHFAFVPGSSIASLLTCKSDLRQAHRLVCSCVYVTM